MALKLILAQVRGLVPTLCIGLVFYNAGRCSHAGSVVCGGPPGYETGELRVLCDGRKLAHTVQVVPDTLFRSQLNAIVFFLLPRAHCIYTLN